MSVQAAGEWSVQDPNGKRVFTYGKVDLAVGDTVRVMAYGYGARVSDVGSVGTVVALRSKRATVELPGMVIRNIDGACLGRVAQIWE